MVLGGSVCALSLSGHIKDYRGGTRPKETTDKRKTWGKKKKKSRRLKRYDRYAELGRNQEPSLIAQPAKLISLGARKDYQCWQMLKHFPQNRTQVKCGMKGFKTKPSECFFGLRLWCAHEQLTPDQLRLKSVPELLALQDKDGDIRNDCVEYRDKNTTTSLVAKH